MLTTTSLRRHREDGGGLASTSTYARRCCLGLGAGDRRGPGPRRRGLSTGSRPSATAIDAATNPSNSGCGRSGRDLNSGWNWLATNHG